MAGLFIQGARPRHRECPEIWDYASWLALMQHYGLPTRLLDWSKSILTAAYFAAGEAPSTLPDDEDIRRGVIWVLSPVLLNEANGFRKAVLFLGNPEVSDTAKRAMSGTGGADDEQLAAVIAQQVDLRMLVQQSVFTLHGENAVPICEREDRHRFCAKFVIPEASKPLLAAALLHVGISRSMLFPDLTALARDAQMEVRLGLST